MYKDYKDIRGKKAKPIAEAMGVDEVSGIKGAEHLVEIRNAEDHLRLSAHSAVYFKEVLLYRDGSLEVIEVVEAKREARKIIFQNDGDVVSLVAPWSRAANGYMGDYKETNRVNDNGVRRSAEHQRYVQALIDAELNVL